MYNNDNLILRILNIIIETSIFVVLFILFVMCAKILNELEKQSEYQYQYDHCITTAYIQGKRCVVTQKGEWIYE